MTQNIKQVYEVELENFKGPLHVLLELIEQHKLPINEISLTQVTDDFLSTTQKYSYKKSVYAEFISIAAILIFIKSNSLISPLDRDDDELGIDSQELQNRLAALKLLKEKSIEVGEAYKQHRLIRRADCKAPSYNIIKYKFPDGFPSKVEHCLEAIFKSLPKTELRTTVKRRKVKTLQEVLKDIEKNLSDNYELNFNSLVFREPEEKVLSFLAILEMMRKGDINLEQSKDDIIIRQNKIKMPQYG